MRLNFLSVKLRFEALTPLDAGERAVEFLGSEFFADFLGQVSHSPFFKTDGD